MIVDNSFNYHSLSLTVMFAIKRSMIVQDSLSKSRNVLASLLRIFFDTEPELFQLHPDCGSHLKKSSTNMAVPRSRLLGCISNYHSTSRCLVFFRFFRFSHFLAFSVTVVRIFVQIIALLFFTGEADSSAVAILH